MIKLKNFKPWEFECKCGCGLGGEAMDYEFLRRLDMSRGIAGIPYEVTSGMRCKEHNHAVGGVDNSSHVRGYAADIKALDGHSVLRIVLAHSKAGLDRIGVYANQDCVHADNDPDKVAKVLFVR